MTRRKDPLDEMQRAQLERNLTNHTPTQEAIDRIGIVRTNAKSLGNLIIQHCPPSRERSLALTSLEDAVMRAVQSIVTEGR